MDTYKVGVVGHFGGTEQFLDGQTVKSKSLTQALKKQCGNVATVDTYRWKHRFFKFLKDLFLLCKTSRNIIIMPALNGVKIFVPLFVFMRIFFHFRLFYVVIGGWLPELVREKKLLMNCLSKLDGVFVETGGMQKSLYTLGLHNVQVMPNFKEYKKIKNQKQLPQIPYKLCTFSRVTEQKGIEDAIRAVVSINNKLGRTVYSLDIYGQIEEGYQERFSKILATLPQYIQYAGAIPYDKTSAVLHEYFLLLFPTYYYGEGFAGTILDAYAVGLPVVASDWRYNEEVVEDGKTGLLFPPHDLEKLQSILLEMADNPQKVMEMSQQCLDRVESYKPDKVIQILLNALG